MKKLCLPLLLCSAMLASAAYGQSDPAKATERQFEEVMTFARAEHLHEWPFGAIMREVGGRFLAAPYAAGLLDAPDKETLIVDLTRFDCVLYVEVVLALARGVALEDYGFDSFATRLRELRYRGGEINGYCSRLHYFSDWILNNEARGLVTNITQAIGGEPLDKSLTFMSEHRGSYPRFATNDSLFRGIKSMEDALADFEMRHVPQANIREVYDLLQDGDILALSTHIKGLDVTHTGLAFAQDDGGFGLLHASTSGGVKVSDDLQAYVEGNKAQIGVVVVRPADPRRDR